MTENKYSVELISGLTPKNSGDFPLIQAKDVEMPDGTRLSELKTVMENYIDEYIAAALGGDY
ncbi:MAG: hypothetical protein IJ489_11655 [Clostridia bacterium]|nr:hypothetical protein [Clostridia bacterium]